MGYREELIEKLKKKKNIKSSKFSFYGLTHTHDHDENRVVYVSAPYSYHTMVALLAFIQFEGCEICQEYDLDQDDIIEVLEKLYDCKKVSALEVKSYQKIDLYLNWELFCGAYDEIRSIDHFKIDGIVEILKPHIDVYLEKCV